MAENWKPANWDSLISGVNCPVCALVDTAQSEDAHGIAVADLKFSRLFLAKNQYVPGYCMLMCRKHVIEPYELAANEQALFFEDMARVGKGLQTAFKADKLNYNILGNVVPHLHVHLVPRYFTDSAPNRPIDPTPKGHEVYLSATDYAERIAWIRAHIDSN